MSEKKYSCTSYTQYTQYIYTYMDYNVNLTEIFKTKNLKKLKVYEGTK